MQRLLAKIVPFCLLLTLLPLGAAGCGTEFEDLALELLTEWADTHDVNPTTPGGAANLAKRAASGSTGNEEADAAIGLAKTARDIQAADKLMEKGRSDRDGEAMDAAIALRPKDWSYRVSRGALAFEEDDVGTAHKQFEQGQKIVDSYDISRQEKIRYQTEKIDALETSRISPTDMPTHRRVFYYGELSKAYMSRHGLTGDMRDYEMYQHYADLLNETTFDPNP